MPKAKGQRPKAKGQRPNDKGQRPRAKGQKAKGQKAKGQRAKGPSAGRMPKGRTSKVEWSQFGIRHLAFDNLTNLRFGQASETGRTMNRSRRRQSALIRRRERSARTDV